MGHYMGHYMGHSMGHSMGHYMVICSLIAYTQVLRKGGLNYLSVLARQWLKLQI